MHPYLQRRREREAELAERVETEKKLTNFKGKADHDNNGRIGGAKRAARKKDG